MRGRVSSGTLGAWVWMPGLALDPAHAPTQRDFDDLDEAYEVAYAIERNMERGTAVTVQCEKPDGTWPVIHTCQR